MRPCLALLCFVTLAACEKNPPTAAGKILVSFDAASARPPLTKPAELHAHDEIAQLTTGDGPPARAKIHFSTGEDPTDHKRYVYAAELTLTEESSANLEGAAGALTNFNPDPSTDFTLPLTVTATRSSKTPFSTRTSIAHTQLRLHADGRVETIAD